MLFPDYKELTETLTTSWVKEFRLLQELVDVLREERLALNENKPTLVRRSASVIQTILNEIVANAELRWQHKERLTEQMGISAQISNQEMSNAIGENEASQIQNLIEGSYALWKVAEEINQANLQALTGNGITNGGDEKSSEGTPWEAVRNIAQRVQNVYAWLTLHDS